MRQGSQKYELDSSPGQSLNGSFRKSRSGFQHGDLESSATSSLSGSFRKWSSTSSKSFPTSRRIYRELKTYIEQLLDVDLFTEFLEDWVLENSSTDTADGKPSFKAPFSIDELRHLDFALEMVSFQQLVRMPCSPYNSEHLKEDEYLALEDFLHTVADGLWRTFWHKKKPFPYFVCCPRRHGSKFYTIEKAIANGRLAALSGAALMSSSSSRHVHWDDVLEFALFKSDILIGDEFGFSPIVICEALFYGIRILLSRSSSKHNAVPRDSIFILVLDPRGGGVVKLEGDTSKLEIDLSNPYQSAAEWIKCHAEVRVSAVYQIWNKLGNANWGDLGTLQVLLATFYSLVQWNGPPRKSISSLAADHIIRLQQRRMECYLGDNGSELVPFHHGSHDGEIVELHHRDHQLIKNHESHLKLKRGEILLLEDQNQEQKCFQIKDCPVEEFSCSYISVALESPKELLTLYVGAHPSRLEPSWEDMNLWYQVQRQTKILNILKEQGNSCKYLPEIVASGRILHSGSCQKQSPKDCCDHPWCGTPILVTYPVGEPLSSIVARDGKFSSGEAIRCCRDCLAALRNAKMANIQHGDICPENVICTADDQGLRGNHSYILVSWGHAVLEERDSAAMNLQFSSAHALQHGKLCPSSDAESLVYVIYYLCGGNIQQQDSIESALLWKQRCWARRVIQQHLGEVSALLKAFADYVDSLCGTTYPLDYDVWLKKLSRAVDNSYSSSSERGKTVEGEEEEAGGIKDIIAESSSGGGGYSF